MKFLPSLKGSADAVSPGVYELRRREHRRVSTPDDFNEATAERNELLGARTEILFNKLYVAVAREMASTFYVPLEPTEEDLRILSLIAEKANISLDDKDIDAAETEVDDIIWRNAARSTTLTLFDHLANSIMADSSVTFSDSEWVDRVFEDKRFNADRLARSGDLADEEVPDALRAAAKVITGWERFRVPGEHIRYQGVNLFLLADEGSHRLHCLLTKSPTIAFVEGELKDEDDNFYVFAANESILMPVGGRLYWAKDGDEVTVAAGDTEHIAPREFSLSLTMNDGTKPTVCDHVVASSGLLSSVLEFHGPMAGGSFAVPKEEAQLISGNRFLLKTDLLH